MSDSFSFTLATNVTGEDLCRRIRDLWSGDYVSVVHQDSDGRIVTCTLSYYFGGDEQKREVRRVVDLLFSASSDGLVWYYRNSETSELAIKADEVLEVDDLFRERYRPSFYNGVQYFYQLTRP